MTLLNTTIKARSPLAVPTDLQAAQNRLAIAIKNHIGAPSKETLKAVFTAQAEVFSIEDGYREGYMLLLEYVCSKQRRPQ